MKWLNLLFISVVVFAFNACEKHSVNELSVIQMGGEAPAKSSQKNTAPDSAAPADNSTPAAKYY